MRIFFLLFLLFIHFLNGQNGYFFVKTFTTEYQKETNHIGAFEISENGIIFASNSQGILAFDGKTWSNIITESPVRDLEIYQNHLYYLTDNYLGKINTQNLPFKQDKFLELKSNFQQIERQNQNLFLYSEEEILIINLENLSQKSLKLPNNELFAGILRHKDEIWVLSSTEGFFSLNTNTLNFEPIKNSEIFENQYVQNYYNSSNALYIVTLDNAIYVYENSYFKLLGQYNSSKNSYIHGIIVIDDEIIAATNNQGILVINKNTGQIQQQISTIHGLPDNESHSVFLDKNQGIWLAHPFHFSRIYWSKKFEDYTNAVGLIGNIHSLATLQEQIWVGTDNGLFYLTHEIPKESEMVSFTFSKTIIKRDFIKEKNNESNNVKNFNKEDKAKEKISDKEEKSTDKNTTKEKKGFFNKLKDKFSKKDKKNKNENKENDEQKDSKLEANNVEENKVVQPKFKETQVTYQENYQQVNIKSAENYRKYLVFKPIQGISEIVYDVQFLENRVLVGTQKGFYEIVDKKIVFKLPTLCYKITDINGNLLVSSNQKLLKLQKNGNSWEVVKTFNSGRFINSLVVDKNYVFCGTSKGYFVTNFNLQEPRWFLESNGNIIVRKYQSKLYALSSKQIYRIENEPIPLNLNLPNSYQLIPSHEGIYLHTKSLILALNAQSLWDTLYYSRLLNEIPSYLLSKENQYLISGNRSILKIYKQSSKEETKVYVRGFSVTGKSFWGSVFKDSVIHQSELNLGYGDYNIHVKFSCSNLFDPDAVQYFVSINKGEWALVEGKDWILYNLPPGNYSVSLFAILPNGTKSDTLNFNISIALPFWKTWWFYIFLIGLMVVLAYFYTRYKLRKLEEEKRKIEEENQILEQKVEERTREIALQKKIIEEKNTEIMDSLRYSERIQQAMLPKEQQIKSIFENNCFILYMPRDVVSGDFYWLHEKDHQLLVAAGDCTGHGVPGALMSMIGISLLNRIRDNGIKEPAKILSALHKEIHESLKQGSDNQVLDGMDIAIVLYEPSLNKLTFASAMRPIFLIRDNELIVYKGDKKSIGGKEPEKYFSTHELFLEDGDIFYLFSDGYADQFNPYNQKYQVGRFRKKLLEIHQLPLKNQKEILEEEILRWKGDAEQVDDIMVIGIKHK